MSISNMRLQESLREDHSPVTLAKMRGVDLLEGMALIRKAFPNEGEQMIQVYLQRYESPRFHYNHTLSMILSFANQAIEGENLGTLNLAQRYALYWNASKLLQVLQKFTFEFKNKGLSGTQLSWRARMFQHDVDHIAGIKNTPLVTALLEKKIPDTDRLVSLEAKQNRNYAEQNLLDLVQSKLAYLRSVFETVLINSQSVDIFSEDRQFDLVAACEHAASSVSLQLKASGSNCKVLLQNGLANLGQAYMVWNQLDLEMIVREMVRNSTIRAHAETVVITLNLNSDSLEIECLNVDGEPFPEKIIRNYTRFLRFIASQNTSALDVLTIPTNRGTGLTGMAVLAKFGDSIFTVSNSCHPYSSSTKLIIPLSKLEVVAQEI